MQKLTYKEAYDKIIDAYFKDEIQPYNTEFCFCGTLGYAKYSPSNNGRWMQWAPIYTTEEYTKMENALLKTIADRLLGEENYLSIYLGTVEDTLRGNRKKVDTHPNYEDALFEGMCKALDELKEIHRQRGEDVDSLPQLTKRKLQTA